MARLVVIGREIVGHKKDAVAARAKLARLQAAYLDEAENLAKEVRATARAATARGASTKAAQGDIDFLDGVNLRLLGDMIDAFESAHDLDPSIPWLVPIATRRLLGKRTAGEGRTADGHAAVGAGRARGEPSAPEGTGATPENAAPK